MSRNLLAVSEALLEHNDRLETYFNRYETLADKKGDAIDEFYDTLIANWIDLVEADTLDGLQGNIRTIRELESQSSEVMQLIIMSNEEMTLKATGELGVKDARRQPV
ncbi:MAG: hypothetical protein K940chlam2_00027 [Chlamydiae bacterium]|nr:hypothetical protein [Chlamydiota bacterium]